MYYVDLNALGKLYAHLPGKNVNLLSTFCLSSCIVFVSVDDVAVMCNLSVLYHFFLRTLLYK